MSLRWRIALGLAVVAALVSAAGATAAYLITSERLADGVDESLVVGAAEFRGLARVPGLGNPQRPIDQRPAAGDICPPPGSLELVGAAQIVTLGGAVTTCVEGGPAIPVDRLDRRLARARSGRIRLRTLAIDGVDYRVVTISRPIGGAVQLARNLDETHDVLDSLRRRLVLIGLAGVALAGALGWYLARRTVRPVEQLRDTAEEIARTQDLQAAPLAVGGAAEIASLARSFTTMVEALADSRREQHRLVSDASHELRTPLTSLRTNAELLARADELDPAEYREVVDSVRYEVGQLTDLVSELVELATDRSTTEERAEPVDLAELARQVSTRAQRRTGRPITVTAGPDSSATVVGRPLQLERAIANLVENACKYGGDGPIEVLVHGRRLEVRDHGPGIDAEDLPHVFDRFYRAARTRTAPGSGLGLAIVRQTVERHGGTVWARPTPGGGATVGFELGATPTPGPDRS
jgi:two-component system sensor histidine kinase MprB